MTDSNKQQNDAPTGEAAKVSKTSQSGFGSLQSHLIFWPLAVLGLALDLWTKTAVFDWLTKRQIYSYSIIDGFFQIVLAENAGAAFGIASGKRTFLIAVSLIAVVVVFLYLFIKVRPKIVCVALALFFAGICGNLYDRLFNDGYVRDFIDIYYGTYHWPAFNIADSMLCAAVVLLIIYGYITEKSAQKHAQQQK